MVTTHFLWVSGEIALKSNLFQFILGIYQRYVNNCTNFHPSDEVLHLIRCLVHQDEAYHSSADRNCNSFDLKNANISFPRRKLRIIFDAYDIILNIQQCKNSGFYSSDDCRLLVLSFEALKRISISGIIYLHSLPFTPFSMQSHRRPSRSRHLHIEIFLCTFVSEQLFW